MGSTVWLRDDVRNKLRAIYAAHEGAIRYSTGDISQAYSDGFVAAVETVARALGIPRAEIVADNFTMQRGTYPDDATAYEPRRRYQLSDRQYHPFHLIGSDGDVDVE